VNRTVRGAKGRRLDEWHFYADRWHNREMTCCVCGATKPGDGTHPKGWMKRYTPETKTQARCPKCSEPALFKETT
jgi:hypothetical protein